MKSILSFFLMTVFFSSAEEKEYWYGADGKPVREVRGHEKGVEKKWRPQWVAREEGRVSPAVYGGSYGYGGGVYRARSTYVPYYGGYDPYRPYFTSIYCPTRSRGLSGFYLRKNGHSHWGVNYRTPGLSIYWRK